MGVQSDLFCFRMESTEKCEAIIQHFNGKFIKTPPGVLGVWSVCFVLYKHDVLFLFPAVITEFTYLFDLLLSQHPQSPYYASLQTGARRRGRARGSISIMEGPGVETEIR